MNPPAVIKCISLFAYILISQINLAQERLTIENSILNEPDNFYHVDFSNYPTLLKSLPIGVFDSGTGGLTVMDALVNFDHYNNESHIQSADGQLDFKKEDFIYLADQANMPYGNYHATNKDDLLKEHIIKDFQFLLGEKYYENQSTKLISEDKKQVKAIVIACNTATAYGYKEATKFLERTKLDIPVIGVINAAARGTLAKFTEHENGAIGVFATVGTIASTGYERTLKEQIEVAGLKGNIQILNQGGHGIAEAVDEEPDFIDRDADKPRENYRGPGLLTDNFNIDRTLVDIYNFNFTDNQMLCDNQDIDDCSIIQLNSAENYVRFHLVSLLENLRKSENPQPLKSLILGCTHYPYLIKEINIVLNELRDYKGSNGQLIYQHLIEDHVDIVDPSIFVAMELYEALKERNLFNESGNMEMNSEFYISVPNIDNSNIKLENGNERFTYDYKYGRTVNEIQEYVKVVPFNKENISKETIERFQSVIPNTYQLIRNFSQSNRKFSAQDPKLKLE